MASKNGKANPKSEALNPKQIPNTNLNTGILNTACLTKHLWTFSRLNSVSNLTIYLYLVLFARDIPILCYGSARALR